MEIVKKPCKRLYRIFYYFYTDPQEHTNQFDVHAYSMKQALFIFHKYNGYKGIKVCDITC